MVSHQSSSGSHTQATINRNVSRGTLSRNWCSSFLIGTVTNPTNCSKCKTTNLLVRFFRYLWNIIQPIWNLRCDSTKPRRFTTYWVCWLWNSETETCNGTLRKHNCSQFAISNIFYILTFVIFFWPSYGQRETQICCPYYILTSLPVLSTTLRTKPNHVHNGCLQTFLCYKCVSRVMVNVDSIFFPQTFAWNGSYEMSMCLRPRCAHEVRDKYWGAAFFLQILAWDWSCEMSVRSSTLQARTRCGSRSWGMVQGTDNVVPTGCRMPELAAEKLT